MTAGEQGTPVAGSVHSTPILSVEATASNQVTTEGSAGPDPGVVPADSAFKTALESKPSEETADGVRLSDSAKKARFTSTSRAR